MPKNHHMNKFVGTTGDEQAAEDMYPPLGSLEQPSLKQEKKGYSLEKVIRPYYCTGHAKT